MKKAVIDIGTNSTRLLIADIDGKIQRIEKQTIITRLGQDVDKQKRLSFSAMERNIKVLQDYKKIALSYGIKDISAIATSAVRDASNKEIFLNNIRDIIGIDVKVISGTKEAELDFLGASSILGKDYVMVIDIGGGSTEFICGAFGKINFAKSINVGAVRVTEKFFKSGKTSNDELNKASVYIKSMILDMLNGVNIENYLPVGIGGTITSLGAIDQGLEVYKPELIQGYRLSSNSVDRLFNNFIACSIDERKKIKGLQSARADIIGAGTLILKIFMDIINCEYITISEQDNLEGMLIE